jgi:hypothetical protein
MWLTLEYPITKFRSRWRNATAEKYKIQITEKTARNRHQA